MNKYLIVGFGGFLGAIARYWVGEAVEQRLGPRFPYGTFVINLSGCFLIGLVMTLLAEHNHWSVNWGYLICVGFIGAYTTFSTFEMETFRALQLQEFLMGGLYVGLSVILGFLAVWLGVITAKSLA